MLHFKPGMDKVRKKLLWSKKYKVKVWWNLLPSKSRSKVKYWYFYFQKYKVKSKSSETIPNQTLVTSAILSFIEKAFDQIYWRKVFQSLCFAGQFSERNKTNRVERNLSPMTALGPKRAGFQPNPCWVTLRLF